MMQPMMIRPIAATSTPPLRSIRCVENFNARFDWMAAAMMIPMAEIGTATSAACRGARFRASISLPGVSHVRRRRKAATGQAKQAITAA